MSQKRKITPVGHNQYPVPWPLEHLCNSEMHGTDTDNPKTTTAAGNPPKNTKRCQRRQNAPRRFLTTSATIGCKYAPYFDSANPQGVQRDSLLGFKSISIVEEGDTPTLRARTHARSVGNYIMCLVDYFYT